jgi:hypothetical protein
MELRLSTKRVAVEAYMSCAVEGLICCELLKCIKAVGTICSNAEVKTDKALLYLWLI